MSCSNLTSREIQFIQQKELFFQSAMRAMNYAQVEDIVDPTARLAQPIPPVLISDYRQLSSNEIELLADAYYGELGVAHFIAPNPDELGSHSHPLLEIADQLSQVLPLKHPVTHPMEGHREAISRFGPPDGHFKNLRFGHQGWYGRISGAGGNIRDVRCSQ